MAGSSAVSVADPFTLLDQLEYNVLVTEHEEGIPFLLLAYLVRIHTAYKAQRGQESTTLAHATAAWAAELPLLDE